MFEVALAQKTISMGVCCSVEVNSVKMCHSKPRVSNHVIFFFHFLRRIQVSLIDLTAKGTQICRTINDASVDII